MDGLPLSVSLAIVLGTAGALACGDAGAALCLALIGSVIGAALTSNDKAR